MIDGMADLHEEITTRFKTLWDEDDAVVAWPNLEFRPPAGDEPWVRLSIIHTEANQPCMGRTVRVRCRGAIKIGIFTAKKTGSRAAHALADLTKAVFERKSFGGVECGVRQVREVPNETRYQLSVSYPFYADELVTT